MRFKPASCVKLSVALALILCSVIIFVDKETSQDSHSNITLKTELETQPSGEHQVPGDLALGDAEDSLSGNRIDGLPNITDSKFDNSQETFDAEASLILDHISKANADQYIYNEDLFGPISNETVVITIQVHDRIKYLRQLIQSFSDAGGIDKTLLIFSHDVWDEDINYLIKSIDFCMVMQIFYPHSLQTHKNTFPGKSPNDCERDITKEKAVSKSCTNAHWPDLHGHYREAQFTQTKHHWWWKANWIFNQIESLKSFQGVVLFLEEDHFVAEDFLHVLKLLENEKSTSKYKIDILSLGTYLRKNNVRPNPRQPSRMVQARKYPPNFAFRSILWQPSFLSSILGSFKQAEITDWISSKHNMGMAFTRTEWNKIHSCRRQFCKFDDYNWDWSLQQISHHCLKEKFQVVMVKGPRVFHIGECGVHHKKTNCDANTGLDKVKTIISSAKKSFFPDKLQFVVTKLRKKLKEKKPNGGWSDKRDHDLCLSFAEHN